jgi:hypothetical protein
VHTLILKLFSLDNNDNASLIFSES